MKCPMPASFSFFQHAIHAVFVLQPCPAAAWIDGPAVGSRIDTGLKSQTLTIVDKCRVCDLPSAN